jgi:uncharacterized protein involved in outer membrane biogenesis
MGSKTLRWVLVLLVVFLLLPAGFYWLADAWLESAGGRQMLEKELGARFGMSVRLEGEFDLMLLPDIGVSGTELVIGGEADPGVFFASSREFEVSVELKPLFHRQVVVEWIRLTDGRVYPGRYSRFDKNTGPAPSQLPEIRELSLRDFQIFMEDAGAEDGPAFLRVKSLNVSDFAERRQTAFTVDIESLVTVQGWLLWDTAQSKIQFGNLQFDMAGQVLGGEACLLLQDPPSLNAKLEASTFDFDVVRDKLPAMGQTGAGGSGGDLPLDIRARFKVDELRSNGVIARGVVLNLGREPVCE